MKRYRVCALRSRTLCKEWAVMEHYESVMTWEYNSKHYAKRKATELRKDRVISDRLDGEGFVDRGRSFRKVWIEDAAEVEKVP